MQYAAHMQLRDVQRRHLISNTNNIADLTYFITSPLMSRWRKELEHPPPWYLHSFFQNVQFLTAQGLNITDLNMV